MTSQGLGDPFGPGERIEGYRVCGLRGSAFVGDRKGKRNGLWVSARGMR